MKRYKRVLGAIPTERQKEEESTLKKKLTPKSIIVAALALILAASMFGCSKDTTAAEDKTEKTVSTEKVETVQEKAEEPTAELLSNTNTENGTVETVDGAGLQQEETTTEETDEIEEETSEVVELFSSVNETVYATTTVNVRDTYSSSGNQLGSLSTSQSVTRTGIGTGEAAGWSRIEFNGQEAYVKSDYLSTIKVEVSTPTNTTNNNTNTSSVSSNSNTTTTTTAKPSTSKPSTPTSNPSSGGSSTPTSKPSTPTSNPSSGGSSTTQTTPPPSSTSNNSSNSSSGSSSYEDYWDSQEDAWLATQDLVPGFYENAQNSYVPTISQP